jgi:hypothetical protein
MSKQKKSAYNFAYKVGITVFVILVGIVSLIVITITKSCNTGTNTKLLTHDSMITKMDTVYLPNPNAVKVVVHDTVYKTTSCTKRHCDVVKSTKDSTKFK